MKPKKPQTFQTISIPSHPDDRKMPVSLVHIELSKGRFATLCGPLGRKTLTALQGTLEACKDSLVKSSKKKPKPQVSEPTMNK